MNSFDVLRRLRLMLATAGEEDSKVLRQTIDHIEIQDNEIAHLREDITEQTIPDEN